ncbi:MAG: hypothetical protein PSX37_10810, partial [bacterium]|nr:hypothetical protein [bacterium]
TFDLVCAGFFVAFSILGDWAASLIARVPGLAGPYRVVSAAGLLFLLLWGASMYVGVQGRQNRVYHEGLAQAEQLKELVPNPPAGTYFLPVANYAKPIHTGVEFFDNAWADLWCDNWATPTFLKHVFRRNDVYQGFYNTVWDGTQHREPIGGINFEFITFAWRGDSPYGANDGTPAARIPLDKVVPFVIDPDGNVRIISSWWVQPQDGGLPFMVQPTQAYHMVARNQLTPFTFNWPEPAHWPWPRPTNGPVKDPNIQYIPPGPVAP